jgi:hypothetical protein
LQGGLQTGGSVGRLAHHETVGLEVATHGHPNLGLVVDDQDTLHENTFPDIAAFSSDIVARPAVGPEHTKHIKLVRRRM